jgi:hypothetical protein
VKRAGWIRQHRAAAIGGGVAAAAGGFLLLRKRAAPARPADTGAANIGGIAPSPSPIGLDVANSINPQLEALLAQLGAGQSNQGGGGLTVTGSPIMSPPIVAGPPTKNTPGRTPPPRYSV